MADNPFVQRTSSEDTPWVSVSDLMSGLMLVFLCIAVLFMREVKQDRDRYADVAEQYSETRVGIQEALEEAFPTGNPEGAEVIPGALIIRFLDKDAGYADAQETVPLGFKQKLEPFTTKLLDILESDDFKDHVVELRIEGHTSSGWANSTAQQAYLKNMDLSQARSLNVLKYILALPRVTGQPKTEQWLKQVVRANGMSSSALLPSAEAEDPAQSKRVEFRIVTDADKRLESLLSLGETAE